MDEDLRLLAERIERVREQLHRARGEAALLAVSRRMDVLVNEFTRLAGTRLWGAWAPGPPRRGEASASACSRTRTGPL